MINPVRSEAEAFRALIWGVCIVAVIVAIVLIARAL